MGWIVSRVENHWAPVVDGTLSLLLTSGFPALDPQAFANRHHLHFRKRLSAAVVVECQMCCFRGPVRAAGLVFAQSDWLPRMTEAVDEVSVR